MKCNSCGTNLEIDDNFCKSCGTLNPYAKQHREDMATFKEEFQETKEEVVEKTTHFTKWTVSATIIAILLTLNVIGVAAVANHYRISDLLRKWDNQKKEAIHLQAITTLWEQEDYMGFSTYFLETNLWRGNTYDSFREVKSLCSDYNEVYRYVLQVVGIKNQGSEGKTSPEEKERIYQSTQQAIMYFYQNYKYAIQNLEYEKKDTKQVGQIELAMQQLLQAYTNLTKEEVQSLLSMETSKRQALLLRSVTIDEE